MPSILFSHPTGSTMAKASLQALQEEGYLYAYCTSLGFSNQSWLYRYCLPNSLKKGLSNRTYPLAPDALKTHFFPEVLRLLCQRLGLRSFTRHELGRWSADSIFQNHDQWVARWIAQHASSAQGLQAVYGYEDSCLQTFQAAKKQGLRCIYELPIAYWETSQSILKEESLRYPAWEPTLLGNRDSGEKNNRKKEELSLADLILCPSTFVKHSLPKSILQKTPIAITPYGGPTIAPRKTVPPAHKLRCLFVGSLTQRKGLADVFEAFKLLKRPDLELIALGQPILPLSFYYQQYPALQWERPRANADILEFMKTCHLLILPSLVEGRAIVQLEALACGLPIIITGHTGGEDLVDSFKTGLLVPIRSPHKIAEALSWFADNKGLLPQLQELCIQKAQTHSWDHFKQRLITALQTHL